MPCAFADPAFMQAMFREFQGLSGQHNCRGAARFGSGGCDVASPFATFLNGQRIEKYETDESYFIFVRTGLNSKSLKVTISEGRLTISKAPNPAEAGSSDSCAPERIVLGSWDLPEDVFQDGVFAKLEDGELFISLPKIPKEEAPVFDVPIEDAASSPRRSEEAWVNVEADAKEKDAAKEA